MEEIKYINDYLSLLKRKKNPSGKINVHYPNNIMITSEEKLIEAKRKGICDMNGNVINYENLTNWYIGKQIVDEEFHKVEDI